MTDDQALFGWTQSSLDDHAMPAAVPTDESADEHDSEDNGNGGLEDLVPLADRLFIVWVDGSEAAWADHAWKTLRELGLCGYSTAVGHAHAVVRLIALSIFYKEFAAYASGISPEGGGRDLIWEAFGDYPKINPVAFGVLVERLCVWPDWEPDYDDEIQHVVLRDLVRSEHDEISSALLHEWGENALMASMWASMEPDVEFPLPDEKCREILNADITGDKMATWNWIQNGFPLT